MASLVVVALSDSFASLWPVLAEESGLELRLVADLEGYAPDAASVTVVAAGGEEAQLEPVLRRLADADVAAVGATASHRLAAAVTRAGAADYFALPEDQEALRAWISDHAHRLGAAVERRRFAEGEAKKYRFDGIFGTSAALSAALERAARVIPHPNVTVLLSGETGTGKELLARAIHYNGPRREAPFVDVNCAAIPDQLLESELFGHERGAFTGATSAKPGLFELADGGTLFLDEIGHLALGLQGKLLRALEERVVRRVGGTRTTAVNVRVIAASHVRLADAVRRGEFREDLFHRINVVPIELPPLRARREDIVPLVRHFLRRFTDEYGLPLPTISASAERDLAQRDWLGNVRELRNAVERALLLGGETLSDADFAYETRSADVRPESGIPFPASLSEIVRTAARQMVSLSGGNKSEAARRLGVSRARLQRLLDAASTDDLTSQELEDVQDS